MKPVLLLLTLGLFACNNKPKSIILENMPTVPVEKITATKDQQERRKSSEAYCKQHNVPIYTNPTSLFVDPEEAVELRTQDKVVDRALALFYTGIKNGESDAVLATIEKAYHIRTKLTPKERAYVFATTPTEQQKVDADWKYECLHVLLWSLGYIDSLSYPNQICSVAEDVKLIHNLTEQQFRDKAKLRSKKEILDQADLILRLHWACEDARMKGIPAPANLNGEILQERHVAINWLIRYMDQSWDDVTADT